MPVYTGGAAFFAQPEAAPSQRPDYHASCVACDEHSGLSGYHAYLPIGAGDVLPYTAVALYPDDAAPFTDNATGLSGLGFTIPVLGIDTNDVVNAVNLVGGHSGPANPAAQSLVTKWHYWYRRRPPTKADLDAYIPFINLHGVQAAWDDFNRQTESIAVGVQEWAKLYQDLGYGGPFEDPGYANSQVAPPTDQYAPSSWQPQQYAPARPNSSTLPATSPRTPSPAPTVVAARANVPAPTNWPAIALGAVAVGAVMYLAGSRRKRR